MATVGPSFAAGLPPEAPPPLLPPQATAITAVVLGGTSIFGGRGSVHGTLLGLTAVALLQNGLRLADQPAELAGILTGVLLIGAIGANRLVGERSRA